MSFLISISVFASQMALIAATAYFTSDDIETNRFSHLVFANVSSDVDVLTTYALDLPIAVILLLFSLIFWVATKKYLCIFESDIISRPVTAVNYATFLIVSLEIVVVALLVFGGNRIIYALATTIFLFAIFVAAYVSQQVYDTATKIQSEIPSAHRFRKFRIGYVLKCKVTQQVQQGWAAINMLMLLAISALALLRPDIVRWYSLSLSDSQGEANYAYFAMYTSWAIISVPLLFLLTGALRSFSAEGNLRHFHAVSIINNEYNMIISKSDGGDIEAKLAALPVYTVEDDPTIERIVKAASNESQFSAIVESSRFFSSVLFATAVFLLGAGISDAFLVLLALSTSFLWNDIVDFRIGRDSVSHPLRPLPSGRLKETSAIATLLASIVVFALYGSIFSNSVGIAPLILLVTGLVYSAFLKPKAPIFAVVVWCAALSLVITSAAEFGVLGFFAVWIGALGREIILDYRDKDGDFEFNRSVNIGLLLGRHVWLASMLFFSTSIGLLVIETQSNIFIVWISVCAVIIFFSARLEIDRGRIASVRFFSLASFLLWPVALLNV